MKKIILAQLFFSLLLNVLGQNAVSVGLRSSLDGKEFKQNQFNVNFHLSKEKLELTYGIGLTAKSLDYEAQHKATDYSHGSPGEYKLTTKTYRYSSQVDYQYLGGLFSVNWPLFRVPKFALFFGGYVNGHLKIKESASSFYTNYTHDYSTKNNFYGYSSYHKESESYEEFDPLKFRWVYGSIGINLSNRFYLKDFFIQGDLSCGFVNPSIYQDRLGGGCESDYLGSISGTCFNYESIGFYDQFSFAFSAAVKVGYTL